MSEHPDDWYLNSKSELAADDDPAEWAPLVKGMPTLPGEELGVLVRVDRYMKTRVMRPVNPRLIQRGPDWALTPEDMVKRDGKGILPPELAAKVGVPRPPERFRGFQVVKPKQP
jgi:hypothetical protein